MSMKTIIFIVIAALAMGGCVEKPIPPAHHASKYFDNTGRDDAWDGGVKMIEINTP
jgi:hypothetical protein